MRYQIQLFFTALVFFTRIPSPIKIGHAPDQLSRSTRYFSLIGILVGSISAAFYLAADRIFTHSTAVLISMIASILVTGAFHEDGLADFCDGFGGGWTRERILEIMRDSRIGVFGAVGVGCALALKYHLLLEINQSKIVALIISGHALSRLYPVWIAFTLPYAREGDPFKPTASNPLRSDVLIATMLGLAPLAFLGPLSLIAAGVATLTAIALAIYIRHWLGGFTGDCLGAIQQITEIVFYLTAAITWKF